MVGVAGATLSFTGTLTNPTSSTIYLRSALTNDDVTKRGTPISGNLRTIFMPSRSRAGETSGKGRKSMVEAIDAVKMAEWTGKHNPGNIPT